MSGDFMCSSVLSAGKNTSCPFEASTLAVFSSCAQAFAFESITILPSTLLLLPRLPRLVHLIKNKALRF